MAKNKQTSNTVYYVVLMASLGLAAVVGLYVGWNVVRPSRNQVDYPENPQTQQVPMRMGGHELLVEIRDDEEERALGLSGRTALGENEGMLFVFDELSQPLFWMKDMLIDIDVVWLRDGQVMQIDADIAHPTEENPRVRTMVPSMPVDMVMELPAGWAKEYELQVGDTLETVIN